MPYTWLRTSLDEVTIEEWTGKYRGREIVSSPDMKIVMEGIRVHATQNGLTLPNVDDYTVATYRVRKVRIALEQRRFANEYGELHA